uniref:Uncharacterized protein n=1 Tax=Arundo donax TaxID=35708 RepID=A0A0A9C2D2_ARUDO
MPYSNMSFTLSLLSYACDRRISELQFNQPW